MTGRQCADELDMSIDDLDNFTFQEVLPYVAKPGDHEDEDWSELLWLQVNDLDRVIDLIS